jgi:carbamoyl-phosphate synthase small subunit
MGKLKAALVLKDGTILHGRGFGASATNQGELVFNTSMTGYQEALTDPSYAGQILMMCNPLIGNYGINEKDYESKKIHCSGFITRQLSEDYSHMEATKDVDEFLKEHNVPGISGIDTRFLVRKIRNAGVMPAAIATYEEDDSFDPENLKIDFDYSRINFVKKVTIQKPETFGTGLIEAETSMVHGTLRRSIGNTHVILIDYGAKRGIIQELLDRKIKVTVVPSFAKSDEIKSLEPDGILLTNGPGDPSMLTDCHRTIRQLVDYPMFGICLGNQLLAHAFGGSTYKLKFGHRGANHPIINLKTKKVAITTQNHGFAVDPQKLPDNFEITHVNLNDETVEGIKHKELPIFSVQYHPESNPGPHDTKQLFDQFLKMVEGNK